jgi:hypothetical protein
VTQIRIVDPRSWDGTRIAQDLFRCSIEPSCVHRLRWVAGTDDERRLDLDGRRQR